MSGLPVAHLAGEAIPAPMDLRQRRATRKPRVDWQSIYRHDVFISYRRSESAPYAAWLYQRLNDADLSCFLDDHQAVAGTPLTPMIEKALDRARVLVVILTDGAHDSDWVCREVDRFTRSGRPIVPIRLGPAMNREAAMKTPLRVIFERDVLWIDEAPVMTGELVPSDITIERVRALFHFRRSKLLLRLTTIGLMLLLASIAVWAILERFAAIKSQKIAVSQELAVRSELSLPTDPRRSLDFAWRAALSHPTPQAVTALRRALRDDHAKAVIGGGDDPVRFLSFSGDGRSLATLHHPWRIEIRSTSDLASMVRIDKVANPDTAVIGLAFGLRDSALVSWSNQGRVEVWSVATGARIRSFGADRLLINASWLAPDGAFIAIPADTEATALNLWDTASGTRTRTLTVAPDRVTAAAFSADSRQILLATLNSEASATSAYAEARSTLRLFDRVSGEMLTSWPAGQLRIGRLAVGSTGKFVVSAIGDMGPPPPTGGGTSKDRPVLSLRGHHEDALKIWRRDGASYRQVFTAQSYQNPRIQITPDERLVIFADESDAKVISTEPVGLYQTLSGHRGHVTGTALVAGGDVAATASSDGSARLWSLQSGRPSCEFRGHVGGLRSVEVTTNGRWAATVGFDGSARLWNTQCGYSDEVALLPPPVDLPLPGSTFGLQSALGTGWVAQVQAPMNVLWKSFDAAQQGRAEAAAGAQAIVAVAAGARRLAVVANDGQASIVHADRVAAVPIGPGESDFVFGALSDDGTRFVRGSTRGVAVVFDAVSGRSLRRLQRDPKLARNSGVVGPPLPPGAVPPRPEGSIYVAARFDGSGTRLALSSRADVELWSLTHDKLVARLTEHREPVRAMHFSPSGNRLLTLAHGRVRGSGEAPILWSADDGRLVQRLQGSQGVVVAAAFTPDSQNVLTASSEGHLRLFAADTGLLRTEGKLPPNSRSVRTVALSTTGDFAAIGSEDGRLYLVAVDTLEVLLEARLATKGVLDLRFDPHSQTLAALLDDGSIVRYACLLCAPVDKLMAVASARLDGSPGGRQVMGTRP